MNMNEPGHISAFLFTISGSSWENTLSVFIQIIHRFLLGVSIHDIHPYACSFSSIHASRCLVISYLILVRQGAIFTFHAAYIITYFVKDQPKGPYNLPII